MSALAPALFNPPTLSATELHEILLTAHAGGNALRRRFMDGLRTLEESKLYLQLGFPNLAAYTDATFHYGRSQAYNFVRVSRALDGLPRLAQAFERGEISFSLLSRLTHVATLETEGEWLEHCRRHPLAAIDLEIRDAIKKKRNHPRKDGYGLPGLPVKVCFEFSPDEHAVLTAAIKKVAQEMSAGLDGVKPDPKAALLYLSERILETDPARSVTGGRSERPRSPFAVVYHRCPDCLRATVETEAGRVEVSSEALDRIEPHAEPVALEERDQHNTPRIRFEVQMREGERCANPYCRRELAGCGQAHHLKFWSEGGRTELSNLAGVCPRCHGLVHQGLLTITGDPAHGLEWKVACEDLTRSVREAFEVKAPSAGSDSKVSLDPELSTIAVQALVKLGWSEKRAGDLLLKAMERFQCAGCRAEANDASALVKEANRIGFVISRQDVKLR